MNGLYPIAVAISLLHPTSSEFMVSDGLYSDANYQNKTKKVIHLQSDKEAGFDWLKWLSSQGSAKDLATSLTGEGNVNMGFEEASWPIGEIPAGYPQLPGQLNANDWVYGNTGVSNSSDVREKLDLLILNKVILTLPVYDMKVGNGSNLSFHVVTMRNFLLLSYSLSIGQEYIELVAL